MEKELKYGKIIENTLVNGKTIRGVDIH